MSNTILKPDALENSTSCESNTPQHAAKRKPNVLKELVRGIDYLGYETPRKLRTSRHEKSTTSENRMRRMREHRMRMRRLQHIKIRIIPSEVIESDSRLTGHALPAVENMRFGEIAKGTIKRANSFDLAPHITIENIAVKKHNSDDTNKD